MLVRISGADRTQATIEALFKSRGAVAVVQSLRSGAIDTRYRITIRVLCTVKVFVLDHFEQLFDRCAQC